MYFRGSIERAVFNLEGGLRFSPSIFPKKRRFILAKLVEISNCFFGEVIVELVYLPLNAILKKHKS
ncbi:hypothetical protein, partial [Caldisericum sp.]|uniref:hypothetical protein n=1 Tax=Caldisericum sp. TaxID=2499687 RepID=UPI003D10C746